MQTARILAIIQAKVEHVRSCSIHKGFASRLLGADSILNQLRRFVNPYFAFLAQICAVDFHIHALALFNKHIFNLRAKHPFFKQHLSFYYIFYMDKISQTHPQTKKERFSPASVKRRRETLP